MKNIVLLVLLFYITTAFVTSAQVSNDIFPTNDSGLVSDDNSSVYYGNDSSNHDAQNYVTESNIADTNITIDATSTRGTNDTNDTVEPVSISDNGTNTVKNNIAVSNDSEITIKVYRNPGQFLIFEILLVLSVVVVMGYMLKVK